jgi:hypothetical protein
MRPLARLAAAAGTLAITAALGAAAPALAAPTQSATLTKAKPSFAWDGGVGNGLVYTSTVSAKTPCNDAFFHCETILLHLPAAVDDLTIQIAGDGAQTTKDMDLHLYTSDKDGTQGDLLYESTSESADEAVATGSLDAGYYLGVVDYYLAVAGSYKGTATITPLGMGTTEAASRSSAKRSKRVARNHRRAHR